MIMLKARLEATGQVQMAVTSSELAASGVRLSKRPSNKQRKRRRKDSTK